MADILVDFDGTFARLAVRANLVKVSVHMLPLRDASGTVKEHITCECIPVGILLMVDPSITEHANLINPCLNQGVFVNGEDSLMSQMELQ